MDKIEVGEYVRTISGSIDKVDALYGIIENTIHLENHKWQDIKNIVKHSFNILDLIELDDYVVFFDKELPAEYVYQIYEKYGNYLINSYEDVMPEDVKSIFTHEQLNEIEYRLEENNG